MTNQQDDYPYIRAWGRLLGSNRSHINEQVRLARMSQAPTNAVYRDTEDHWVTIDDITSANTRRQLGLERLPPVPPVLATIAEEVAYHLRYSARLADLFDTEDVEQLGDDCLKVRYPTGYAVIVELTLHAPPPAAPASTSTERE